MATPKIKRYVITGIEHDTFRAFLSRILKDKATHSLEQIRTPKGDQPGEMIIETSAPFEKVQTWYQSLFSDSKAAHMARGTTLDVYEYSPQTVFNGDDDEHAQIEDLARQLAEKTQESHNYLGQVQTLTGTVKRLEKDGLHYLQVNENLEAKLARAQEKVGDLARQYNSANSQLEDLRQSAEKAIASATTLSQSLQTEQDRYRNAQANLDAVKAQLDLELRAKKTPKTLGGLIDEWVSSHSVIYSNIAATLAQVPEVFDKSTPIEELVALTLQQEGLSPNFGIEELGPAPLPFEETEYHKLNQALYEDAKKVLELLVLHRDGKVDLPSMVLTPLLSQEESAKQSIKDFQSEQALSQKALDDYQRKLEQCQSEAHRREVIQARVIQERQEALGSLEQVISQKPAQERVMPIFMQQLEKENVFVLEIILPVGKEIADSSPGPARYLQNMLAQIAVGNTAVIKERGLEIEQADTPSRICYQLTFGKSGEPGVKKGEGKSWNSAKLAAFRSKLEESMLDEASTFPLFKFGYRLETVYVERGLNDRDTDDSTILQTYILGAFRKAEHLTGRSVKFRLIELVEQLEHDTNFQKDLLGAGIPKLEGDVLRWKVTNAVYALKDYHNRLGKDSDGQFAQYFLLPAPALET